ncbi:hypothetical protein [Acidaminobacter sp. JC074]|nr:hypothetical protein [Acidaminobacter sp. JC074]
MEEKEGVKFVVNTDIIDQFGNFNIDYTTNFFRKGFVVSPSYGGSSC